jgi:hypothetical protein
MKRDMFNMWTSKLFKLIQEYKYHLGGKVFWRPDGIDNV